MNCREVLGQKVIPIFYEVSPTDIKKQTGDFGKAFRKSCQGKTKDHIERWTNALKDVAQIAGEHSRNWENDAAMIERISTNVSNKLNMSTPSRDFDGLVGMRAHMEELEPLLRLDLNDVRMIGIWGPPGIGKTTIARFLFHQVSNKFQLGTIMYNIKERYPRPCLNEYNAQLQLQKQMLSHIINHKDIMISHLGVAQERLKDKKVILVLDDVDHSEQLIALAKETGWFGPGSRIIITTENQRVLKAHWVDLIYKVKSPSIQEAFQIFCMHAFGKEYPDHGFYELAWEVTELAGELPLGLKILGSALRGKSKQEWKMTLPSFKTSLNGDIKNIIKFSYKALFDEEKDLFLYITCIMNYYSRADQVEELLAKRFSDVSHSLRVLEEKSFISINKFGNIEMHTLLKQFGRETSRKRCVHGIAKRQFLIDARDICDDTIDSSKFIGINFKYYEKRDEELNISEKAVERMSDIQFVTIVDHHDGVAVCERLESVLNHSQKIRYLLWNSFKKRCLPSTFNPEYLVELKMCGGKLEKLWEGNKPLKNLKWMNLSSSHNLKELPDLSTATNLRELDLSYCLNLMELPSSIGSATNLQKLNISGCSKLRKLPSSIGDITCLKEFDLSHTMVSVLPQLSDSLTLIYADGCTSLERLDCSFNNPEICLIFTNCFKLNQKARDIIIHTSTNRYAVLPGTQVPTCFNYRSAGGSLTIKLNEMSHPTSLRFKTCITLDKIRYDSVLYESINIMVKDKRLSVKPTTQHIYAFEVEVSEVTSTELVFEFKTDCRWWKVGKCGLLQILEVPIKGRIGEKRARNTEEGEISKEKRARN